MTTKASTGTDNKPTASTKSRRWIRGALLLAVLGGLVGLTVVLRGRKEEDNHNNNQKETSTPPPLRGSDCRPSCGNVQKYIAPVDGLATLASGQAWWLPDDCRCDNDDDDTTVRPVTTGQVLYATAAPRSYTMTNCPVTVDALSVDGTVPSTVMIPIYHPDGPSSSSVLPPIVYHPAPSCRNDGSTQGRYYDWTAPSAGVVTLATGTVVVTDQCTCQTYSDNNIMVAEGQGLRLWTPADETHPLQLHEY